MHDDAQLLAALRRREPDAFATLFEAYSNKMFRLAVGLLRDDAEAEGVVQEVFLRLFENMERFDGRARLGTWLYRVTYNRSIDLLRRRRPTVTLDGDQGLAEIAPRVLADWRAVPERMLDRAEVAAELDRAIAALPEKYRVVFLLREIEGLSTQETAAITGISGSAAKVRLHRARLFLREQLADSFVASAARDA